MKPLFAKPLSIVQPIEDSSSQCQKFVKTTHLLLGAYYFFVENINGKSDKISKAFEVLENSYNMGTCIHYFKEYLAADIKGDEEFYVNVVSTFMAKSTSLTNEERRK